ncbi:MAG TPA: GNAT family N-acetyltransferase [Candidatus Tumulicola sp.]|nr:GNAT family N-acetyltransferase [Candidatus Tumulicola sp.]
MRGDPFQIVRAGRPAGFRLLHQLLLEYEWDLAPELRHGAVPPLETVRSTYVAPNAAFVALRDGGAAGCVAVRRLDPQTAVLARLFVRPPQRGHGIARALVARAVGFARRERFERIVLDTDKEKLPAAYRLYLSEGFRACAPYETVDYGCPTYMQLRLV